MEGSSSCSSGAVSPDSEQKNNLVEGIGDQPVDEVLHKVLQRHKSKMKNKYESLFEGLEENKTLLNGICTQLYIIEGESEGGNKAHEVLQMERIYRTHLQVSPINYIDILKHLQGPEGEPLEEEENITAVEVEGLKRKKRKIEKTKMPNLRSVLTKGIAGIGKTVSVQKFILDWAEGKANQDVELMFVLPFRELNLIKDDPYSLHGLLCDFHPELKDLDPKKYDQIKAVFIFDGLDESRIPLDFEECEKVSHITMTSSVGVLMTNLIRGELLPSALIWITSRPAAANQIPPKYINRVTEIQGFSDPQKEEYFRRRLSDEDQAGKIISHIKTVRSLHIMCHIPVFCWISATVLQQIMKPGSTEIPRTLTEMYSHFLLTQTHMKNEKYEEEDERDPKNLLESNRTILLKLAELAFKQLMKGNVVFYEEDLRESRIDVTEASVYSGIFTEIFREECVLYQRMVYCFVHLSFQEFLAAVYVFHCYQTKNTEALQTFIPWYTFEECSDYDEIDPLDELLEGAVDEVLESQNGHLDLFLRFLLSISVEANQRLLQGLLTSTQGSSEGTREHIKRLIKRDCNLYQLSTERSINLFLCLSEMNDQSLSREIQELLQSEKHSEEKLSPGQCSALAYMVLSSGEVLDELDLKKYDTSKEGYRRLIPAVAACRKTRMDGCSFIKDTWETLCSAIQSTNSSLKDLDLSNNHLGDSRVELLSTGLKSVHCKLEILRLAGCHLTITSCEKLSSSLQSVNTCLKALDLSDNDLQDSGVELLASELNSHCKLEILRLADCHLTTTSCEKVASSLQTVNSYLKELDLSNNDLQDSGVELLSVGLKSSHCKLEKLKLAFCKFGGKICEHLGSALQSVPSLKELDLSYNDLEDSGVKLLCDGLRSSNCLLEILRLSGCMITHEGCFSLASAIKSNPSHLRELDLAYNYPGKSGVKLLSELLQDPHCTLDKLQMDHEGKIRSKSGLRKYAVDLTLDPNTVNSRFYLSEGNRKLEWAEEEQCYPDHPDRFDHYPQVLSVESLTGRCYWEVQCDGEVALISVSYKGITRKGSSLSCVFGHNNHSWSLECPYNRYYIRHNNQLTELPAPPDPSNRVGVYLDWESGTLTFYTISPNTHVLTHLHTLYTTFNEPLYAGFSVVKGAVRLCEIE